MTLQTSESLSCHQTLYRMLIRFRLFRWSTYRLIILSSFIWILVGFSVLVYYMDCLGSSGINCVGGKQRKLFRLSSSSNPSVNLNYNGLEEMNENDLSNLNSDNLIVNENANSLLQPYKSHQLRKWKSPGNYCFNYKLCSLPISRILYPKATVIISTR